MTDLFSLAGRTALVTGGSRGIGRMIAAGFIAQGARVYISNRKTAVAEQPAERRAKDMNDVERPRRRAHGRPRSRSAPPIGRIRPAR